MHNLSSRFLKFLSYEFLLTLNNTAILKISKLILCNVMLISGLPKCVCFVRGKARGDTKMCNTVTRA